MTELAHGLRARLRVPRQRRAGLLLQDEQGRAARAPRRDRRASASRSGRCRSWSWRSRQAKETIEAVSLVNNQLIVLLPKDAHALVKVFDLTGKLVREVELPGPGHGRRASAASGPTPRPSTRSRATRLRDTIYRYDLRHGTERRVWKTPKVDFEPRRLRDEAGLLREQGRHQGPDVHRLKKGLKLDGKNPTLLYGYGGFNISLTPDFSVVDLVWLEHGRRLRRRQPPRRRRVRRGVAPRRARSEASRTSSTTSSPPPSG